MAIPTTADEVRRLDRDHVLHSWSAQAHINPLPIKSASGASFSDYDGNTWLDFASQLVNSNIGHQHPKVVQAIKDQAEKLCFVAPAFANDARSELARLIAERAPGDLNKVFFTNGGAEANENAIRMARVHTGKQKILSAYRSYHGATHTAITATGDPRRWASDNSSTGIVHFFGPYAYRSAFGAKNEAEELERSLGHLEQLVMLEGPGTIAGILLETIVGTNGVLLPPDGYLAGVREICDKYGIMLIADEVMVGFGRVGEWFAINNWGVTPDLLTFAKGVNSGYVPLGGVVMSKAIADTFEDRPFPGGLTYSGHPLACAAGVASIEVFEEEKILEHVKDLGERVLRPRLDKMAVDHPSIGEIRGKGLFFALELVTNRETHEPLVVFNASGADAEPMTKLLAACKERGVWPFTHFNRLHIAPPLVISEEELVRGLDVIDEALKVADEYYTG
ncbi:aspartate aminotransferase family protein [Saxibacter everestensis]|uniref:Aspartate aminotransferase family protein n=1 Tax=Saxibacter everestensis TaxID=2909229 RepID=A0ABY8QT70_9MICO|nr:aspartate aminotransferase family protein [Brevibacteriaceae bacterium ZFBP1038]